MRPCAAAIEGMDAENQQSKLNWQCTMASQSSLVPCIWEDVRPRPPPPPHPALILLLQFESSLCVHRETSGMQNLADHPAVSQEAESGPGSTIAYQQVCRAVEQPWAAFAA